jgi:hypothetical protein
MKYSAIGSFGAAFAATAVILAAGTSNAAWRRASANGCHEYSVDQLGLYTDVLSGSSLQNVTSRTARVNCDVEDGDTYRKQDLTAVNIHGYDASDTASVTATLCVAFWSSEGGACGTSASSGSPNIGNYTLQPSRAVWNATHAGDFGYISLNVPARDPQTGDSTFRGYFTGT